MRLSIRVPEGEVVSLDVRSVKARDAGGEFMLLPRHVDFLTVLQPCIVSYRGLDRSERYVAVDGGLLLMERGVVAIVTREAVAAAGPDSAGDAVADLVRTRREQEEAASRAFADLAASLIAELPKVRGAR